MSVFSFPMLGAIGLGSVFGWTMYFAIRGKSGNVSASEFAAIVGALAGGTMMTYFSEAAKDATGTVAKSEIIGAYGLGVFIGFAAYFLVVSIATRRAKTTASTSDQMMAGVLESLDNVRSAKVPNLFESLPLSSRSAVLDGIATSNALNNIATAASETSSVQSLASSTIEKIDGLREEIAGRIPNESGDKVEDLRNAQIYLTNLKISVLAAWGIATLNSSQIQALFSTLSSETVKLNQEAEKLRSATNAISQVNNLLSSLNSLRDAVQQFA